MGPNGPIESFDVEEGSNLADVIHDPQVSSGKYFVRWVTDLNNPQSTFDLNQIINKDIVIFALVADAPFGYDSSVANHLVQFKYNNPEMTMSYVLVPNGEFISTPNVKTINGYDFNGWYTSTSYNEQFNTNIPITRDYVIYGQYKIQQHEVLFYDDNNNVISSQMYDYGTKLIVNNAFNSESPQKTGFYLIGWSLTEGSDAVANMVEVTRTVELYPVFAKAVTLTFDVNKEGFNTIGTNNKAVVPIGYVFSDDDFNYVREGFTFLGWYTDAELTNPWNYVAGSQSSTIYAKWESKWAPYYNPEVVKQVVLLGSNVDSNGYTHYLYYLGTAKDVLIDVNTTAYANNNNKIKFTESITTGNTITNGIAKSIESGSKEIENTTVVTFESSSQGVDGWGLASGICSVAAGVCSFIPGLNVAASVAKGFTMAAGVAGAASGGLGIIGACVPDSQQGTEFHETKGTEVWKSITTTEQHSESISVSKTLGKELEYNLVNANSGDIVIFGILANVEYLQVVSYDKNGNKIYEGLTFNTYGAREAIVSVEYHGSSIYSQNVVDNALSVDLIEPIKTCTNASEENTYVPWEDFQNYVNGIGVTGKGTLHDPYVIKDYPGLHVIKMRPNAYYKLGADIDMTGIKYWEPFVFEGLLDGNGKTIHGLTQKSMDLEEYKFGLFSEIKGGKVFDLTLADFELVYNGTDSRKLNGDTFHFIGALAGTIYENSSIRNVDLINSTVKSSSTCFAVGGLSGDIQKSTIENCDVSNCTIEGRSDMGGLVAFLGHSTMNGCTVKSSTINTVAHGGPNGNSWGCSTGGLVGCSTKSILKNSSVSHNTKFTASGEGEALYHHIGYLVGYTNEGLTLDSCTYTNVTFTRNDSYKGGVWTCPDYDNYNPDLAWFGFIGTGFDDGNKVAEYKKDGKTINYYTVRNGDELRKIESDRSGIYIMHNDIAINSNWNPLCGDGNWFAGKLYGMGHTIWGNNHYINASKATDNLYRVGLFAGCGGNALIQDLTVSFLNIDITNNDADSKQPGTLRAGIIAGNTYGESEIINCIVDNCHVKIEGQHKEYVGGGVVGMIEQNSSVKSCKVIGSTVNVYAQHAYAGGFVGMALGSSTISDCTIKNVKIDSKGRGWGLFDGAFPYTYIASKICASLGDSSREYNNSILENVTANQSYYWAW